MRAVPLATTALADRSGLGLALTPTLTLTLALTLPLTLALTLSSAALVRWRAARILGELGEG